MKKRLFTWLLCLTILLVISPLQVFAAETVASGTCGENLTWTLDDAGKLTIFGIGPMYGYTYDPPSDPDIPWYENRTEIKAVVIEDGVTSIGMNAFLLCDSLREITIPEGVTSIGDGAFYGCSSLTDVYYGGTESEWDGLSNTPDITRIHYNCPTADGHWTEGQTPPTCGETGVSFEACSCGYKRNEETIPATGEHAYEAVVIPPTCEENGYTTYTCANCGDTYTGDETAAEGHIWSDATCTAPMTCSVCHAVEEGSALGHDWGEWEETKAASCTEDGSKTRSCRRCGETETETVPATDHTPDENGICTVCGDIPIVASGTWGDNITWTLDAAGKLTFSGEGAMLNCGVQGGAWYSLRDKIYTVQVEEGITSLGSYAFTNCGNLTTVILPDSLRTIGGAVFHQCGDLAEITMPEHLERIEAYAFSYSGLVSVAIPESVTYLGEYAFTDCTKLKTFTVPATFTKVPAGLLYGCKSLESVTIPEGITVIGEKAFCNCYALKRADIPAGVTKLERKAFAYNSALEAVTLPEGLLTIDTYAFAGCTKLTEINLPNSVVSLGGCLFSGCSNLVSAHLPENITELPGDLFYNCLKLENVNIPESVTAIGGGAFQHTSITEITIPEGVSILEISVLRLCSGLTSVTIPENVTQVRSAAFQDCDNLTEIIFTGHAPSIDSSAFTRVTATVYYPLNDPSWTADVMRNYGGTLTWKGYNSENPFTDVPEGGFYYEPVLWAVENGITSGTSETSFGPNDACLRAHVVTFLWRAAGSPEPTNSQNPFVDVAETGFYYKAVLWAVEKGITTGSDATHFNPFGVCNRAAVVTFLWRAAGSPEPESTNNPFVDVTTTAFYYKAVLWAVENGITNGVDATHFGPTADCNRAQVVTFLYRVYNK